MVGASQTQGMWTLPMGGSPYPLMLVPRGSDPTDAQTRFSGAVMVALVLVSYLVVTLLVNTGVVYVGYLVESPGTGWPQYFEAAASFATPWGVLGAHLGLAGLILVVWGFFRFVHRRQLGWLWSVSPGVRWRYGVLCLVVALIIIGAVACWHAWSGPGWQPAAGWGWYALVIVLATPFQALGEEVLFRGYLMQALGAVFRQVWFPIVGSALVFALFHGTQNPWLFGSRLAFGLLAGVLVWRTGGLEAGVAIHIANNLCAFALALSDGSISSLRTTTAVDWSQSLLDVGMFAGCALACWGIALGLRVPVKVRD